MLEKELCYIQIENSSIESQHLTTSKSPGDFLIQPDKYAIKIKRVKLAVPRSI